MNFDGQTWCYGIVILKAKDRQRVSLSKFIKSGFARENGTHGAPYEF